MRREYEKGYYAGQKSKAIEKAEPSDIVQDTQSTQTIRANTSTTAQYIHINNGTGTVSFRISNL